MFFTLKIELKNIVMNNSLFFKKAQKMSPEIAIFNMFSRFSGKNVNISYCSPSDRL